jgi:hypothetical protein
MNLSVPPRIVNIPAELKERPQWVVWKQESRGDGPTKVPYQARKPDRGAKSNDSSTWATFAEAWERCQSGGFDGIGFMFSSDDPYFGVDLDRCLENGKVLEWAAKYLERLKATYGEVSPSGTGIKFIGRGKLPEKTGTRRNGMGPDGTGALEVYDHSRYFTITGDVFADSMTIVELPDVAVDLYRVAKYNGKAHQETEALRLRGSGSSVEERVIAYLGTCEPAISGQGGHDKTFSVACRVGPGFDLDPQTAFRLLWQQYNPRCQPPWSEAELRHKIEDAYQTEPRRGWLLDQIPRDGSIGAARPARPEIILTTDRHIVEAQTVEVMRNDPELFSRGDVLGVVVDEFGETTSLPGGVVLQGGCSRFLPLSKDCLSGRLTRLAQFVQHRTDKKGNPVLKRSHPPDYLIGMVMTRGDWPVRRLLGIASAPWVRRDGSFPLPGFEVATGTLFRPAGDVVGLLGDLPSSPDRDEARAAADRLFDVVRDFPFASLDDRAVWLAGLLTAIQRPAIAGAVPGIVLNSNKAGTGKGLLVDVIGITQSGAPIPTRPYPRDSAEAGKVTLSLALAGITAVHFDNLTGGRYGSSELDSALTSTIVSGRILGASKESGPIPLRPCWFISGNNLSPGRDAFRRWLPCNLKTALENPHERGDLTESNLRQYVASHRGELLRDALTILRAHAFAGRPVCGPARLGSFEDWDLQIRGAVYFATGGDLGGPGLDCLTTMRKAVEESPEFAEKRALLDAWAMVPGAGDNGKGMTCAYARELSEHIPATKGQPMVLTRYPDLRNALLELSRDGKLPSTSAIGYKIRGMKNENVGGRCFQVAGDERGSVLWRVATL